MPLKENLRRDTVDCLPMREPLTVTSRTSVGQAVAEMNSQRSGCVLVVDGGRLAGIFTERDLVKRVLGKKAGMETMISAVMTADPAAVRADERISAALKKMTDGGYRHLPVLDKAGKPIGRVSMSGIVHYMVEHFPKAVYNLPPTPDQVATAPDGA